VVIRFKKKALSHRQKRVVLTVELKLLANRHKDRFMIIMPMVLKRYSF